MEQSTILSLEDIHKLLPFKRTKIQQLLNAGVLPVVKIGRDYITTQNELEKWISDNLGKEIYY